MCLTFRICAIKFSAECAVHACGTLRLRKKSTIASVCNYTQTKVHCEQNMNPYHIDMSSCKYLLTWIHVIFTIHSLSNVVCTKYIVHCTMKMYYLHVHEKYMVDVLCAIDRLQSSHPPWTPCLNKSLDRVIFVSTVYYPFAVLSHGFTGRKCIGTKYLFIVVNVSRRTIFPGSRSG